MSSAKEKLAKLRAQLKKEKERTSGEGKRTGRGDFFPFWEMNMNESAKVRILPDKNEENPLMYHVNKLEHRLSINGKMETIPCLQMYGEQCPICDLSRKFYKEEGKGSTNGKYYYRKKTSMLRVLVLDDPLPVDEETKENSVGKVVNTQFSYQLMEKINEELSSPDMDTLPFDFDEGYDFIIKKTPQGEYGTYSVGSGFARRPSAIPDDYRDLVEDNMIDLATLLPTNPGYEVVKRKLDEHLNGTDSDEDDEDDDEDDSKVDAVSRLREIKNAKEKSQKVEEPDEDESDDSDDDEDDDDAEKLLAQIRRNRKK